MISFVLATCELIAQLGQEAATETRETKNALPLHLLASAFETMGLPDGIVNIRQSIQLMEAAQMQQKPVARQMQSYQRHGMFSGSTEVDNEECNALDFLYDNDQAKNISSGRK